MAPANKPVTENARPFSFMQRLKEISMFFAGKDEVYKSLLDER